MRVENRAKREADDAAACVTALQAELDKVRTRLEGESRGRTAAEESLKAEVEARQAVERTYVDVCRQLREEEQARKAPAGTSASSGKGLLRNYTFLTSDSGVL
eukprot:scaffold467508_cov47-Prasinocladus_malaysianus.AAC.1